MSNLKKQILDSIHREGITPTSRFYFITRNYFFWLLFVVSIIVGAISFSSVLFQWVVFGELVGPVQYTQSSLFVQIIPLFWIVLLILFTISAWYNVTQTNASYKRENAVIVLSSILFSLLFGLLLFRVGVAHNIDVVMKTHIPPYRISVERDLERAALFMQENNMDARELLLQRERLRTICFNTGGLNCGTTIDQLSDEEVAQKLESQEMKEINK